MDEAGHLALRIAREAAARYLAAGIMIEPPPNLPSALQERAGVFVTIRQDSLLRGCVGTLRPTTPTVAHEIIANAIAAATADPRFPAIHCAELPELNFEVDILCELEPVRDKSSLDPSLYGVVVEAESLNGVLLPRMEGVTTIDQQIEIARAKAGIPSDAPLTLHRFAVTRYREELS